MRIRVGRILRRLFIITLILLILVCIALSWLLATESGARFALQQAEDNVAGLDIDGVSGSLLGSLSLATVRFTADDKITELEDVSYQLDLGDIWSRKLTIKQLRIARVTLPPAEDSPTKQADTQPEEPLSDLLIRLPATLHVDSLTVGEVIQGNKPLLSNLTAQATVAHSPAATPSTIDARLRLHLAGYELSTNIHNAQIKLVDGQFVGTQATATITVVSGTELTSQAGLTLSSTDDGLLLIRLDNTATIGAGKQINIAPSLRGRYQQSATTRFSLRDMQLVIDTFALNSKVANVRTQGKVDLNTLRLDLTATLKALKPHLFNEEWPGDLDAHIALDGTPESLNATISQLRGKLRGYPVSGGFAVNAAENVITIKKLLLNIADSTVNASGKLGLPDADASDVALAMDMAFATDMRDLAHFVPKAGGTLTAKGTIKGDQFKPQVVATLVGQHITMPDLKIETVNADVDLDIRDGKQTNITATIKNLTSGTTLLSELQLTAKGTPRKHTANLTALLQDIAIDSTLQGGLINTPNLPNHWRGTLATLNLNSDEIGQWRLNEPAQLDITAQGKALSSTCLVGDIHDTEQRLCVRAKQTGKTAKAHVVIEQLQAQLISTLVDGTPIINGIFTGKADIDIPEKGEAVATFNLGSERGTLKPQEGQIDTKNKKPDDIKYRDFAVKGSYHGGNATVTLSAGLEKGQLTGDIKLAALDTDQANIDGTLTAQLPSLAFVSVFAPDVQDVRGNASANIYLKGNITKPQLTAGVDANIRQATLVSLGIKPRDIKVSLNSIDKQRLAIRSTLAIKDNRLSVTGQLEPFAQPSIAANFRINGNNLALVQTHDLRMWLSPALTLKLRNDKLDVGGKVNIERGKLLLKSTEGIEQESDDVVILDAPEGPDEKEDKPMVIKANVLINFVEPLLLEGQGLDGQLTGSLRAILRPDQPELGNGELRLVGTYTGYGQNLVIKRGRVLYSNTPLDNPGLDILAVRQIEQFSQTTNTQIDNLEVGLQITGTANKPIIKPYANQAMDQGDMLAYLLLGKPVDALNEEEGGGLAEVATQLGLAGGDKISRWIANRFGIDRIYIKGSSKNARVVVGKRISKQLYVNFQRAIFEPINELHINYKLSKNCTIDAVSGSDQGMDFRCSIDSK